MSGLGQLVDVAPLPRGVCLSSAEDADHCPLAFFDGVRATRVIAKPTHQSHREILPFQISHIPTGNPRAVFFWPATVCRQPGVNPTMFRTTLRHGLMFSLLLLPPVGACQGQDVYLTQIYGQGVHALFRGEIDRVQCLFDQAISNGSQDPRVYYYRAVLGLHLGAGFEARNDVQLGAELEAQGSGSYDIGMSLERVQGQTRLEFECLRREALLAISQRRRFEDGSDVNRLFDPGAIRSPIDPGRTTITPGGELPPDMTDPFEDDEGPRMRVEPAPTDDAGAPPAEDAIEAEVPSEDAFEDSPDTDADATDDDPFGQPEVEPADDDDPFALGGGQGRPVAKTAQDEGDPLSGLFD